MTEKGTIKAKAIIKLRTAVLIILLALAGDSAQAQVQHNFFGDDYLSFRENHNWIANSRIEKLYVVKEELETNELKAVVIHYDHNGLPVLEQVGRVDSDWSPGEEMEHLAERHFMYVMDELFLRQEITKIEHRGGSAGDTLSRSLRFINYFNRGQYETRDGQVFKFEFAPGSKISKIEIQTGENNKFLHFDYQNSQLISVAEERILSGGDTVLVRVAEYEYDYSHRPSEIVVRAEDQIKRTVLRYDRHAFPESAEIYKNDELVQKQRFFFVRKE